MSNVIPKKTIERFNKTVPRFQQVLTSAVSRDINESDTVAIVSDIMCEVLGYDKYLEITGEFAIRGTYCDLAVKINNKVQFIIEVKAVGIDLKDAHMKQACDYGANHGVPWIILTNGVDWRIYIVKFEQPISYTMVYSFNMLDINPKSDNAVELLYVISREGIEKDARESYYEKVQIINKFIVGNMILREEVLGIVCKELKRLTGGEVRVNPPEIENLVRTHILKREISEGDEAESAKKRINRFYKKAAASTTKKHTGDKTAGGANDQTLVAKGNDVDGGASEDARIMKRVYGDVLPNDDDLEELGTMRCIIATH